MVILCVNFHVRSPPSCNPIFRPAWPQKPSWAWIQVRSPNPVRPRPGYCILKEKTDENGSLVTIAHFPSLPSRITSRQDFSTPFEPGTVWKVWPGGLLQASARTGKEQTILAEVLYHFCKLVTWLPAIWEKKIPKLFQDPCSIFQDLFFFFAQRQHFQQRIYIEIMFSTAH